PASLVQRALALTIVAVTLIIISTTCLLIFERCSLMEALFDVVSAFGTVGLSTGITPSLSTASKIVLIATMFIGRIGISTLSLAIAMRSVADRITYPEDTVNF
ncbi:MAG: potassium transporter TrkG, partial [Actinomycetota bacterium]|nr:potassium transporter TrkG [Actinomycetota bacterium]MDD5601327.1 potassium transporter TrkG [Actinomycetota bacterium]